MDHEKNISTEQTKTRQETRVSEAHVHQSGATDYQPTQSKRTEKAFGLAVVHPVSNETTERQKESRNRKKA
jgi:hypothetical protein